MDLSFPLDFLVYFSTRVKTPLLDSVCSTWKHLQTIIKLFLSFYFDTLNLNRLTLWSDSILQPFLSFMFLWFFSELPPICQHPSWVADISTDIIPTAFTNAKRRSNTNSLLPIDAVLRTQEKDRVGPFDNMFSEGSGAQLVVYQDPQFIFQSQLPRGERFLCEEGLRCLFLNRSFMLGHTWNTCYFFCSCSSSNAEKALPASALFQILVHWKI